MDNPFGNADDSSPRSSRRTSVYSQANSTRHMLADFDNENSLNDKSPPSSYLNVPNNYDSLNSSSSPGSTVSAGLSLSVNYLPSKFSSSLVNRRGNKGTADLDVPKRGGGLAAFKSNEDRMGSGKRLRWTKFKWLLFFSNFLLTMYSLGAMVMCLLTWFNVWKNSEVIRLGNRTELIFSTLASTLGIFTAVIGWAGILLNNRMFLAIYTLLTWVTFAFLVTPGYITYRKRQYNLEGKVNAQWSRDLGAFARQRIQDQLRCCGYFSPYVEATVTQTCYSRTILPGCKHPYLKYERGILEIFFTIVFSIVPAHLGVMIVALMCSNHVTYRFGKGMMPEAYRLNMNSMAVIMDQYAGQLASQYGPEIADKIMERSRSNMNLRQ